MLSKFYESLYLKVLVNIVVGNSKTTVYIEMLNKKDVVSYYEESFDETYLSIELYEYILQHTKESPFFYISILDNSTSQGAIPTCSKQNLEYYCDLSSSEYKCYKDKWTYYTSKNDLYGMEKVYEKIGVDFIFSPFVVLANFFKDKIDTHLAMFLLIEENTISLSVFNNSELLYAEYLDTQIEIDETPMLIDEHDIEDIDLDDDENSINLDDIDAIDDIDELDDFGDIADLDSIEDIDEFSESKDVEEEFAKEVEEEHHIDNLEDSDGFNEDYQRFLLIQSAVNSFYKNEKYKSEFIENIYIGDSVGISRDLKKYLEEEMFLNVYVRNLHLPAEVCEIAKMELS
ncbi:MAG: hypothetical protein K8R44_03110 [Sulfurimonas sp.]|nr:hypothetical protein [Sulfurimonas sp.]